ncbi:MAG TPA: mechanosensitive ion channel domain-containing protein [Candidatus Saccharimonadales bacterium]|nr:mechanosensitive ion channel domain-containing protein [Candidatus Saccharimonadales bacterium]
MTTDDFFDKSRRALDSVVHGVFNFHTLAIFVVALGLGYLLSQVVALGVIKAARTIGRIGDTAKSPERALRLRRLETYLSVSLAVIRFTIFAIAVVAAWQYTHPSTAPVAIVGASTVFVVLAGATVVPMLRDLTTGSIMIAEQWYNVGDFITVEPLSTISGVVERMNLRSTKLRSLSGEVIWIHNQHIQGVRVTGRGGRTMAIDLFVNSLKGGQALIKHISQTLPVGPTMLVAPLEMVTNDKLNAKLWQITAIGQVAPGREWLLEDFARKALEEYDQSNDKCIVHGPMVRYADAAAERRFKRIARMRPATSSPATTASKQ